MTRNDIQGFVALTGASGFLGSHVLLALLRRKFRVRAHFRSQAKYDEVTSALLEEQEGPPEQEQKRRHYHDRNAAIDLAALEAVIGVDLADADEVQASGLCEGVDAVVHVASPYHYRGRDAIGDYIGPAVAMARSVARAARSSRTVKTMVLTSSFAAVLHPGDALFSDRVYTEKDWNEVPWDTACHQRDPALSYACSKKFAEQSAVEEFSSVGHDHDSTDKRLVVLCPPVLHGPVAFRHQLAPRRRGQSTADLHDFLHLGTSSELPIAPVPRWADVRDVAEAHVKALQSPGARGRFLLASDEAWDYQKLADLCATRFPQHPIARGRCPGDYVGRQVQLGRQSKQLYRIDTTRSREDLDFRSRGFEETFGDAIEQLLPLAAPLHASPDSPRLASSALRPDDGLPCCTGSYLLRRLVELGVGTVFGLPGDFNFGLCDLIEDHPKLRWGANLTELGAAYAADGYSRARGHGPAALLTTWGVGELSAINGIGGAFGEHCPVVHIVGLPRRLAAANRVPLHHSIPDVDYGVFTRASHDLTVAQTVLEGDERDATRIDDVLRQAIHQARPCYIGVPADVTFLALRRPKGRLFATQTPRDAMDQAEEDTDTADSDSDSARASSLCDELLRAELPGVIIDVGTVWARMYDEATRLVGLLPRCVTFDTPMARGTPVSPGVHHHGGTYIGAFSSADTLRTLRRCDLLVRFGFLNLDTNAGLFTAVRPGQQVREVEGMERLRKVLPALCSRLRESNFTEPCKVNGYSVTGETAAHDHASRASLNLEDIRSALAVTAWTAPLTQDTFWAVLAASLRTGDLVHADCGTASFGVATLPLPPGVRVETQLLYNSLGWSIGATLGACLCVADGAATSPSSSATAASPSRVLALVGDGALQTSVGELSSFSHHGVKPLIILLNNGGYAIERALHGPGRRYNDVRRWRWNRVLDALGADNCHRSVEVTDAKTLLDELSRFKGDVMTLLDVKLPPAAVPPYLQSARVGSAFSNPNNVPADWRW